LSFVDSKTVADEDDNQLNIDAGLLTVYDASPINEEEYK
jgi:hypothetical protein